MAEVFHVVVSERGNSVAYKAVRGGKQVMVINGAVGAPYKSLESIVFSQDGSKYAYTATDENDKWHIISNIVQDSIFHHIDEPVFSPDGKHLAYRAAVGEEWYLAVDGSLTSPSKNALGKPVFSADSSWVAYTEEIASDRSRLHITDRSFKSIRVVDSVASPIILASDASRIAVVVTNKEGGKRVMQIQFDRPEQSSEGAVYDEIITNTFSYIGSAIAYEAVKGGTRYLVFNGREEQLAGGLAHAAVIRPDRKAVAAVIDNGKSVTYRQAFLGGAQPLLRHEGIDSPVFSSDGSQYAYLAKRGNGWFVVVNGSEGQPFERVVSPMFSPDGSKLVYRARKDGKRFVVVADRNGETLRQFPGYEQIYPAVFSPDGTSVAYGVKDGARVMWVVEKL